MSKFDVQVHLTENALKEFKEIQNHENSLFSDWGRRYLKILIDLPPRNWLEIQERWESGIFKVEEKGPFDIQGKVEYSPSNLAIKVFVTRFKLKEFWFEQGNKKVS